MMVSAPNIFFHLEMDFSLSILRDKTQFLSYVHNTGSANMSIDGKSLNKRHFLSGKKKEIETNEKASSV
jgi:hypothetical protein